MARPPAAPSCLLRTLTAVVRGLGRRIVRRFVVLKDTCNLAQEPLFLLVGVLGRGIGFVLRLSAGLGAGRRRRQGFLPAQSKNPREEAAHSALVTGLVGFGTRNARCAVSFRTGRRG